MKKYPGLTLFFLFLQSICQSQVPVSQEPMHHKILDNGHVRLLDVHIPPGDTTQFHIHATPSVFLLLTEANTGSQVISEEDRSRSPITHYGNIWFEGFYTKPRIHRVFNRDSHEYRVMDIELTNKNYIPIDSPILQQAEAFTFLFEEKPLRVYRLNLGPSRDVYLPERKADILLILLSDSVETTQVNEKSFTQKGEFLYIPSGKSISLKNNGKGNAVFAFFELK
jgi:hypothetical protein